VTTALLKERVATFGVPMPWRDLPPASFDHRATMEAADAVIVVGNRFTLHTYAPEQPMKRLASPDETAETIVFTNPKD
jgi:hypothetical protein